MSIHTNKAKAKAQSLGAFAGAPEAAPLWELSKRELVEIALRLGALCSGEGHGDIANGARVALNEIKNLRQAKIV